MQLVAEGLSNQQIAQRLVLSLHTVKLYVKHLLAKLGATNRTQAVARARALHILLPPEEDMIPSKYLFRGKTTWLFCGRLLTRR